MAKQYTDLHIRSRTYLIYFSKRFCGCSHLFDVIFAFRRKSQNFKNDAHEIGARDEINR